jgi:DNA-binding transcriptional ArsR family regulator
MLHVPELACTELEQTLPIAKSTISYHIKLLYRARLIDVRRDGRYYHYTPRWDEVNRLVPGLVTLLQERLR